MSKVDHTKAKSIAEFILSGYDPGSEYDLAQAYLDLTTKVEVLTKALEFYAHDLVGFPEDQDMSEVHYEKKGYTALQGGKRAREALAKYKEGIDKDGK